MRWFYRVAVALLVLSAIVLALGSLLFLRWLKAV